MPTLDRFISWSFEEACRALVRKGAPPGIKCNRVGRWWSNNLEKKAKLVDCRQGQRERKEYFVLFSRSGFTENLERLAGERRDLLLWK